MHTQHESTEHRLSRNKILIINSNDNTQSGHSENGLTFKCDYLESLCLRCKDICDGMKRSRRIDERNHGHIVGTNQDRLTHDMRL